MYRNQRGPWKLSHRMKGLKPKCGQRLLETQPVPTGECQKTFKEMSFSKDRYAGSSHDSEKNEIPDKETARPPL